MKEQKSFCPHSNVEILVKNETYKVKGEAITIEAQVSLCTECGHEVFIPRYDDNNLKKAYAIYRKNHDLISPEAIVKLRHTYNLSQRAFATLIGCTQNTIVRYEKGAIPDITYSKMLKLMDNPENVKRMLEDARDKLDVRDIESIQIHCHLKDIFALFPE